MMKTKIAMFLFALGMGTSVAYAGSAASKQYAECKASCAQQFKNCVASGTPTSECRDEGRSCIPDCMRW
jgi:hypothetical protein